MKTRAAVAFEAKKPLEKLLKQLIKTDVPVVVEYY